MSERKPVSSTTIRAGHPFVTKVKAGQHCRIVDTEGNEAIDAFFFSAEDPTERYSAVDTIRAQRNVYLTTGSTLLSTENRPLADDRPGHSRTARYAWWRLRV